jgi:uncharacterized protein
MKLSLDAVSHANQILTYRDDEVVIRLHSQPNEPVSVHDNFILMPSCLETRWAAPDFSDYSNTLCEQILSHHPDVILFASTQVILPSSRINSFFAQRQVGVEWMTLGPACRTYNLLVIEHRAVMLIVQF